MSLGQLGSVGKLLGGQPTSRMYNINVLVNIPISNVNTTLSFNIYSHSNTDTFSKLYSYLDDNDHRSYNPYPVSGGGYGENSRFYYIYSITRGGIDRIGIQGNYIEYSNGVVTTGTINHSFNASQCIFQSVEVIQ